MGKFFIITGIISMLSGVLGNMKAIIAGILIVSALAFGYLVYINGLSVEAALLSVWSGLSGVLSRVGDAAVWAFDYLATTLGEMTGANTE